MSPFREFFRRRGALLIQIAKPRSVGFVVNSGRMPSTMRAMPSGVLPLAKYQSETRPA